MHKPSIPAHDTPVALRPQNACRRVDLKPTTFYELQNPSSPSFDETFPKSFSLTGGRARAYLVSELDAWIARRAATRTGGGK